MISTSRLAVAIAAAGLIAGGLAGCSSKADKGPQTLSAADLQQKLMDQFAGTSMPPKTVVCKDGLTLKAGQTVTCDVTLADSSSVEAVTTVKQEEGKDIAYEINPQLTKDQVAKLVASMDPAMTVTCQDGLPASIGAMARCEATMNGVANGRAVMVDDVNGLQIDTTVHRVFPKEQVQDVVLQKLNAAGKPVETVACSDDVVGKPGNTVECAAVTGNEKHGYVVTLTTIEQDKFDVDYKDAP